MPFLKALTIAGSDSSGGAGIQADLKTFAALGIYGTSAVTAVTAQNSLRIDALTCLPVSLVVSQIRSVLSEIGVEAIKTGMLGGPEIIQGVASSLSRYPGIPLVVDPVMAATSGSALLEEGSLKVLRRQLLPLARVFTPNLPEAEALVVSRLRNESDCIRAAREIHGMGPGWVVLKGGHRRDIESGPAGAREVVDLVFDGSGIHRVAGPYLHGGPKQGTGCTFSAAIAAFLAKGRSELDAIGLAREYLSGTWRSSGESDQAGGPLHHFHAFRPKSGGG
ncbi:MAG: bifunctional hydroxymethylpyrimidine kinase/phosphomethylpyrimidine kinase [Acidobacteria bacterium]|nr:bifunctional hydroxymethylpyrimidine kinase/phosphomethylpyrimidine kinase [Acidobacteriota bacterium]